MRRRHRIVGSEVGEERPLAWLRRGRVRRDTRRPGRPLLQALVLSLLLVLLWLAVRAAIA